MRTVVDRTTVAMDVEVCSFFLRPRRAEPHAGDDERPRTTQVGRVSLALGQGITGRAAAHAARSCRATSRSTSASRGSAGSTWRGCGRCSRCRCVGRAGHRRAQRPDHQSRDFGAEEIEFLTTIAALLAGIVEKGRMQAEAEAQLDRLSQLDAARAELLAVVTHELRTPLAVVRAYVDLLADAAASNAHGPAVDAVENWRAGATDQVTRPRPARRLDPRVGAGPGADGPAPGAVRRRLRDRRDRRHAGAPAADPRRPLGATDPPAGRPRGRGPLPPGARAPARQGGQYAPPEQAVSIGAWRTADVIQVYITDDGPGVPMRTARPSSSRTSGSTRSRLRRSGRLFAARR